MWTAEGWSQKNLELMTEAVGILHATGVPWILAGDFQMQPAELEQRPALALAAATIGAPEDTMCICWAHAAFRTID